MALGGKREGAGRKPNTESLKYKFQSYFTEAEVKALVEEVKKQASKKPELLKLVVEQLFGKAPQRVEMTGRDGEALPTPILNVCVHNGNEQGSSST